MANNINLMFGDIANNISKFIKTTSLTKDQAHNIAELIILLSLIKEVLLSKKTPEINQIIIDLCTHVSSNKDFTKSITQEISNSLNHLNGNPELIEKVNKLFQSVYAKFNKINYVLQIMNLTSTLLHQTKEGDPYNYVSKYL
jgi:hypothetical protein